MNIGVLALQGDVREHLETLSTLSSLNVTSLPVKTSEEIAGVDALIIPGGESTTIAKLARSFGLFELIQKRIRSGLPVYGSCAGMILLADEIVDPANGQETFGGLDMLVRRNAFGRQVDSFETDLDFAGIAGEKIRAVFIRAPWVERLSPQVEVLAEVSVAGIPHPVAVRHGHLFATSFHPEISGDNRIHQYFVEQVCQDRSARA